MKKQSTFFWGILILSILLNHGETLASTVSFDMYVYAYGGTAYNENVTYNMNFLNNINRENISFSDVTISRNETVRGNTSDPTFWNHDNYAIGRAEVSILEASVKTYARADTGTDVSYINSANAKVIAGFQDVVTFLIPKGYYAENVYATFSGHIDGEITYQHTDGYNDGRPGFYQIWDFWVGDQRFNSDGKYENVGSYYENVILSPLLVTAGNYSENQYIDIPVKISMTSSASVPNHNVFNAWAETDFDSTGQFTALEVPDGITWTSESSVFLSKDISFVPIPSAIILFGFGLLILSGFSRRKNKGSNGSRFM